MPLTPEDVSSKRFTTVRLREGYDMTEVDQFLDEVETELTRLLQENAELRERGAVGAAATAPGPDETAGVAREAATLEAEEASLVGQPVTPGAGEGEAAPEEHAPVPAEAVTAPAAREPLRVTTTAEASAAATRLLELAGSNADQLVDEAHAQAERIVAEARTRAEALDQETNQRRQAVFGDIEQHKTRLDEEIERLRTFEREYRAELRTYFEEQLAALDGQGAGGLLSRSQEPGHSEQPGQPA